MELETFGDAPWLWVPFKPNGKGLQKYLYTPQTRVFADNYQGPQSVTNQGAPKQQQKEKNMARRKLNGSLTEDEHDDAIINGHKAEESMEDCYHTLREKLGARR